METAGYAQVIKDSFNQLLDSFNSFREPMQDVLNGDASGFARRLNASFRQWQRDLPGDLTTFADFHA